MNHVLEVKNLTKFYKNTQAVAGISFSVDKGEIVGLLGPNGAGKTTTINMILGVLEPTAGSIAIAGMDVNERRIEALGCSNISAIYAQVPGNMTVAENLHVFCLLYSVKQAKKRVEELLEEFDLVKFRNTKCGFLSSGEQTRVHLAKSFVNHPELLLLDEPTASLDPSAARIIREKIRTSVSINSLGVLWTSHNMQEVETVCDRVLFLSHGKILLEGDPKTLPQRHGKKDLEELFIAVAREPLALDLG